MVERPLRILQLNTWDIAGGAEKIAWNLFHTCRDRGLESWLAVGYKRSACSDVLRLHLVSNSDRCSQWARGWLTIGDMVAPLLGRVRGVWKVRSLLRIIARPRLLLEIQRGYEDFDYPGSWNVLDLLAKRPDILHCHNLHGGYFDLRALPWLSQQVPTILTLHDAWLLSGHCAHSFDCQKWETGCGPCPDLTICPAIKRDATSHNWQRKENIFANSRLFVATPSQWLMRKVEQSILASAIREARVIPNGVNLSIFHSGNQQEARNALDIPQDSKVLLFAGYNPRTNPWKDYSTLGASVKLVAERLQADRVILVCLGNEQPPERMGKAEVRFISFQNSPAKVASFYQAADVYLHASKVDTFPNAVLEAFACGTPVVATAVGGIPEQVKDGETGFLIAPGDAQAMAAQIVKLLSDEALRHNLGQNADQDARERFDLNHQVNEYVEWYRRIAERRNAAA